MKTVILPLKIDVQDILEACRKKSGFFLLESSLYNRQRGRYSFLGYEPLAMARGNDLAAFAKLRKKFHSFKTARCELTPFPAGIVGFLTYDFGRRFENVSTRHSQRRGIPGFQFGFYDSVVTIDHFKKRLIVTSIGDRLPKIESFLKGIKPAQERSQKEEKNSLLNINFTQASYCNAARKVLDYIKKGDIYQANLAQEFTGRFSTAVDPISLYRKLCASSPSCFGGYFDAGSFQIISSSPEMFLSQRGRCVETRPMKGTRGRGQTIKEDQKQRRDLRQNHKEQAELLMVTDLERNDLGRVCDFGSVVVKNLRTIEKYRTVYQATSTVTGRLKKDKDSFDVIASCFPSGSVTGCPKIRSMEIIDELEQSRRGIYTGALGYMSFSGNMAFNVMIRTILVSDNRKSLSFHVGSGIVADSDPQAEYEETLVKAFAMKKTLGVM